MVNCTNWITDTNLMQKDDSILSKLQEHLPYLKQVFEAQNLRDITDETIQNLVLQLHEIIKQVRSVPDEIKYIYAPPKDKTLHGLRSGLVELHLALDQLEEKGRTSSFYKYLLSSQEHIEKIFEMVEDMSEQMATVENNPVVSMKQKNIYEPINFSLSRFRKHRENILIVRRSLHQVLKVFEREDEIWPSQCDTVSATLSRIIELVKDLCELSEEFLYLTAPISLANDQLTVAYYHLNEQVDVLKSLLVLFRSLCRSKSTRASKTRREICGKLGLLMRSIDDTTQKMQDFAALYDQHHFQQYDLETNLGEL